MVRPQFINREDAPSETTLETRRHIHNIHNPPHPGGFVDIVDAATGVIVEAAGASPIVCDARAECPMGGL